MARTASGEGFDVDLEMLLIIVFAWGAGTSLGLIQDQIIPFIDAGAALFDFGNATITLGRLASIASLVAVFVWRDAPLSETSGIDLWIVYATIALVVAPPLFPAFQDTLAQAPAAFIAFTVQSTGFLLVSYIN
ncbi:hypothetical protein [Halapricum hydrolyticum]|uniref:Uncharacterized protein n=1 Tax=Halapricum hydrolyticum TaxID=2979991 RepID=A0AAE3IAN7_9EURY|nr:hypothetical protein [Halapricum hydrolyticum]MCU4716807.1 hypothetical protein [Halapricum hydrolyticum]MCU4725588.1 hypothetical protein [Halapricum hydrolyticum]